VWWDQILEQRERNGNKTSRLSSRKAKKYGLLGCDWLARRSEINPWVVGLPDGRVGEGMVRMLYRTAPVLCTLTMFSMYRKVPSWDLRLPA